ncbi:MAG: SUMF1/EgtB/PvdO family nonheme iron enzyme [Lewinellaceae bacterium]|nr:SUMF1/EgtB/PvdO family nonheme iron enzyme [Lewinellaceae bacterium]
MKEDLNNIINLIESQIRNGNISKGLDIIAAEFKKINTYKSKKLAEQAEMLISRLGYLRSNIREGVIAQSEINLEHNKIVQSTIGLKQKLKAEFENSHRSESKFAKKKLLIWLIPVFVGLSLLGYEYLREKLSERDSERQMHEVKIPDFETICDSCPVYNVSWYDAVKFAEKYSEMQGIEYGRGLPTEEEWEKAARGNHDSNSKDLAKYEVVVTQALWKAVMGDLPDDSQIVIENENTYLENVTVNINGIIIEDPKFLRKEGGFDYYQLLVNGTINGEEEVPFRIHSRISIEDGIVPQKGDNVIVVGKINIIYERGKLYIETKAFETTILK